MSEAEASLGKLAAETWRLVLSKGWRQVVSDLRGHSNISAGVRGLPHKAARLLDHLRHRGPFSPWPHRIFVGKGIGWWFPTQW